MHGADIVYWRPKIYVTYSADAHLSMNTNRLQGIVTLESDYSV